MHERLLNVGSGDHPAPGWVNLDVAPDQEPDVRASVFDLPFPDDSFDRVYLGHVLEHIVWDRLPEAMDEVKRVARSGGNVLAVGPCIHRAIETGQPQWLITDILADPREEPGPEHAWTPTAVLTQAVLLEARLADVHLVDLTWTVRPMWPNTDTSPWQVAVRGTVP